MNEAANSYRTIPIGQAAPDAVTVGIEAGPDGTATAAIWWDAQGDTDAEEVSYADVEQALIAAEAARELHDLKEWSWFSPGPISGIPAGASYGSMMSPGSRSAPPRRPTSPTRRASIWQPTSKANGTPELSRLAGRSLPATL